MLVIFLKGIETEKRKKKMRKIKAVQKIGN